MKDNNPIYKLSDNWVGPLTVIKVNTNGTYHLSGINSRKLNGAVNGDKLKKYYEIKKKVVPNIVMKEVQEKMYSRELGRRKAYTA